MCIFEPERPELHYQIRVLSCSSYEAHEVSTTFNFATKDELCQGLNKMLVGEIFAYISRVNREARRCFSTRIHSFHRFVSMYARSPKLVYIRNMKGVYTLHLLFDAFILSWEESQTDLLEWYFPLDLSLISHVQNDTEMILVGTWYWQECCLIVKNALPHGLSRPQMGEGQRMCWRQFLARHSFHLPCFTKEH